MKHRDIPSGVADVIVCEAFVGNVILKLYEGLGATLISMVNQRGMMSYAAKQDRSTSGETGSEGNAEDI